MQRLRDPAAANTELCCLLRSALLLKLLPRLMQAAASASACTIVLLVFPLVLRTFEKPKEMRSKYLC